MGRREGRERKEEKRREEEEEEQEARTEGTKKGKIKDNLSSFFISGGRGLKGG